MGEVAVRLMWSLMSTGWPGEKVGRRPPHPLVSTTVRAPAATAVRTPCTTAATPRPSYRWVRPRKTSARVESPTRTDRSVPACPSTAAAWKPGSSVTGSSATVSPSSSAAGTQPEPITRATSCRSVPVSSRSRAAASPARA